MATCRKCYTSLAEGTEVCPVCGLTVMQGKRKKSFSRLKVMMFIFQVVSLLLLFFNLMLNMTAAYYAVSSEEGLILIKATAYSYFPMLEAVDISFYVIYLLSAALVCTAITYCKRMRYRGLIFLAVGNGAVLFSTLCYPILIYAVSGFMTPMFFVGLGAFLLHAALGTWITLSAFKSNLFIY